MLFFFQKIKTLSAQKIAPPFKITVNSALESKSIKAQLSLEKEINIISFLVKFLCLLKLDNKSAFLEGFGELFSKCYEFLDFPSFDNFEEVTSFPSIWLAFHRNRREIISDRFCKITHNYPFLTKLALFHASTALFNASPTKKRYFNFDQKNVFEQK